MPPPRLHYPWLAGEPSAAELRAFRLSLALTYPLSHTGGMFTDAPLARGYEDMACPATYAQLLATPQADEDIRALLAEQQRRYRSYFGEQKLTTEEERFFDHTQKMPKRATPTSSAERRATTEALFANLELKL